MNPLFIIVFHQLFFSLSIVYFHDRKNNMMYLRKSSFKILVTYELHQLVRIPNLTFIAGLTQSKSTRMNKILKNYKFVK